MIGKTEIVFYHVIVCTELWQPYSYRKWKKKLISFWKAKIGGKSIGKGNKQALRKIGIQSIQFHEKL